MEEEKNYDFGKLSISKKKTSHTSQDINAANCDALIMMQYIHRLRNVHYQTTATNNRQLIPVDIEVEYLCDNIICHYTTSVIFL